MHRFYLPPAQCQPPNLVLTGAEAHHAADVLRVRAGEAVSVLDGAGKEFSCVVRAVDRKTVSLEAKTVAVSPAPSSAITLVQAVPKGKLLETIMQKATELGAARIIPLLSERVIMQLEDDDAVKQKEEKWRHVAVEAIKQCGQRWLPKVDAPVTLPALLKRAESFDLSLVGSLREGARHPREYFAALKTKPAGVALWIGPEGDFSGTELDAIEGAGAKPIDLGRLVLRSDTAALYVLAIASYELQSA